MRIQEIEVEDIPLYDFSMRTESGDVRVLRKLLKEAKSCSDVLVTDTGVRLTGTQLHALVKIHGIFLSTQGGCPQFVFELEHPEA